MNNFERSTSPMLWVTAIFLALSLGGCGGGGGSVGAANNSVASASVIPGVAGAVGAAATNPTVVSSSPSSGSTNVPTSTNTWNGVANVVTGTQVIAIFSEAMDPATIISPLTTFTLKETTTGTNVPGTVTMNAANTMATFIPTASALIANTSYTSTVSAAAKNAGGIAMPNNVAWSFTTNASVLTGQAPVNLATAGDFVMLADTAAITYNGTAAAPAVTGDVGIATLSSASITGFSGYALDGTGDFATVAEVVAPGRLYAPDYIGGGAGANGLTPAKMTTAKTDIVAAYNDAAGRTAAAAPPFLNAGTPVGTLDTLTLAPGVYTWGGNVVSSVGSNVTLSGGPDDVWIFQIAGFFHPGNGSTVTLANPAGGALPQAKNIFWVVAGSDATLGTTAHMEGVILTAGFITFNSNATANGRLLARTSITLGGTVTKPAP